MLRILLVFSAFLGIWARANTILFTPVREEISIKEDLRLLYFEEHVMDLYESIGLADYGLGFDAFDFGLTGYYNLRQQGHLNDQELLTIIDFTKSSTERRFYMIDLAERKVIYHELCSHGVKSGEEYATSFSNKHNSRQSSIGFFVTAETYYGAKGFSLKLDGFDPGYNDNARGRGVVLHRAQYAYWLKKEQSGRIGKTYGCPAVPYSVYRNVIKKLGPGSCIFAYYDDELYLQTTDLINKRIATDHVYQNWCI